MLAVGSGGNYQDLSRRQFRLCQDTRGSVLQLALN